LKPVSLFSPTPTQTNQEPFKNGRASINRATVVFEAAMQAEAKNYRYFEPSRSAFTRFLLSFPRICRRSSS